MSEVDPRVGAFHARCAEYRALGHDRVAAAHFVVEGAGALSGPALDVGTGKGLLAMALARRAGHVVSVDIDSEEQALARLLAEEAGLERRISFVQADAAHLPYPDGHFGCVAMMDVLHHLTDPGPVLGEMGRLVGPGGIVVIADFDEHGFELVSRVHGAEGRVHPRSTATVEAALRQMVRAGFEETLRRTGQLHELLVLTRPDPP
ncbi:MAG: class I SAM-dependent methyltransferase [Pseudomonadota bacterium]